MAGFTLVGGIKYLNDVLSGNALDPFATNTGESVTINNLKTFASDIDKASQQNWTQMQADIKRLDDSYRGLYGKSVFSDAYQSDLRNFNQQYVKNPPKNNDFLGMAAAFVSGKDYIPTPTAEEQSLFFYTELSTKGQDYIFQRDHKSDFDNRESVIGRGLGDIKTDFKNVADSTTMQTLLQKLIPSLIDPGRVQGDFKSVPHTPEFTAQMNQFAILDKENAPAKLLEYIKTHPGFINAAKIRESLEYENAFMENVVKNWNGESISKSFTEGDFIGGIKQLTSDGVQVSENIVRDAAQSVTTGVDNILDSDLNPLKSVWDLIKDLFANGGNYITYALFLGVAIGVLFLAGQIKYVVAR